ncbi:MAG: bifunctional adenosylcobinamide kinase/adenosylcobinamide-phosphate guanylyltransferase [Spirulinaceae cyanobacterium]
MNLKEATAKEIILITGPASSGKSEWAEKLAQQKKQPVIYVATGRIDSNDEEWRLRIAKHASRRPPEWETALVPRELAAKIRSTSHSQCLLVDSLGTWLANILSQEEEVWQETKKDLLESLHQTPSNLILVGEETGWGIVPAYPLGRTFRDRLGNLIREIGAIANVVYLVTGGHALNLTTLGTPLGARELG